MPITRILLVSLNIRSQFLFLCIKVHNNPTMQTTILVKKMCIHKLHWEHKRTQTNQTCKFTTIPITKPHTTLREFWTEENAGGRIFNIFIAKQVICLRYFGWTTAWHSSFVQQFQQELNISFNGCYVPMPPNAFRVIGQLSHIKASVCVCVYIQDYRHTKS